MKIEITNQNFAQKMLELLDAAGAEGPENIFAGVMKQKKLIAALADFCRPLEIRKQAAEVTKSLRDYADASSADPRKRVEVLWLHGLERWANAPTETHAFIVAYILLPILDEYIFQVEVSS